MAEKRRVMLLPYESVERVDVPCKGDHLMAEFFDSSMTPITDSFFNGRRLRPESLALSIAEAKEKAMLV